MSVDAPFQSTPEVPSRIDRDEHDYLYLPNELHFAASGPTTAAQGWAVFPQERDNRRRPALIDGSAIKISSYFDRPPTSDELYRWSIYAATANTAIILGEPSGNTFVLDIDVTDEQLSCEVQTIAEETLGLSPFRRVGEWPKIALFYRTATAADLPKNKAHRFKDSEHAIETLAHGKAITSEGLHHKTGSYFTWLDANPISSPPQRAPMVTGEQLREFIRAVHKHRPLVKERVAQPSFRPSERALDGLIAPPAEAIDNVVRDERGYITDGREGALFRYSSELARRNASLTMNEDGIRRLAVAVETWCELNLEFSGRWASQYFRRSQIGQKLAGAALALRDGRLHPFNPNALPRLVAEDVERDMVDEFSWLPGTATMTVKWPAPDPERAAERALVTDRTVALERMSSEIDTAFGAFLDDVYASDDDDSPVHLIKAPTGSGKTFRAIMKIAQDPRTYDQLESGDALSGPFVVLLPTYNNIDEQYSFAQVVQLDPASSDEELVEGAVATGLFSEEAAREQVGKIRRHAKGLPLRTMVYRGKIAAGCLRPKEVEALEKADIGSSVLCRTKIKTPEGETEERFCPHYSTCPAIAQRREIERSHIVFAVHNYATVNLPDELKHIRGVVADEKILDQIAGGSMMPAKTLELTRSEPLLTKKEVQEGFDAVQLLRHREEAADIALRALREGKDPADELFAYSRPVPGGMITGADLVAAAKRVCGGAISRVHSLDPSLPDVELDAQIADLVARPAGADAKKEYGFWATVSNRIEAHISTWVAAELGGSPENGPRGKTDSRIQRKTNGAVESIRVSYLKDHNWAGVPWALLDASADEQVTRRLFHGRELKTHDVNILLNLRTLACLDRGWSIKKLLPAADATPLEKLQCATHLAQIRYVVCMLSGLHANGQVVIGMPMKLRKAVCYGWTKPANIDFVHPNATSGLDFGRQHVAVAAIGRIELPFDVIDTLVAALTYRDPEPEAPIDVLGTGADEEGKRLPPPPQRECHLKARNGGEIIYRVREHEGELASAVQKGAREEQNSQIVGRARPIFRPDTVTAYLLTQAVPQHLIIDQLAGWDELVDLARLWNVVRRTDGIIESHLMAGVGSDVSCDGDHTYFEQEFVAKLPDHITDRYHTVVADGRSYLVPGLIDDPVNRLKAVLKGFRVPTTSVTLDRRCVCTMPPADERPMDKIEAYLATTDKSLEQKFFQAQADYLNASMIQFDGKGRYAQSADKVPAELLGVRAWSDTWYALSTIDHAWINDAEEEHPSADTSAAA